MNKKQIYAKLALFVFMLSFFNWLQPNAAAASNIYGSYTAPDGFQVVSYAQEWADVSKLKGVYEELLKNTHGEEFKLLRRIDIHPGSDPQGMSAAGRWFGRWEIKNGIPILLGNSHIDIYNGSSYTSVPEIARTLSHEYGHHFTYYYYFKTEKRPWEQWRNTGLASARNLKYNMNVSTELVPHKWIIQEIAAEDYVQLLGSPTAKESYDFQDIGERIGNGEIHYDTNIFNFHPQENYEIPLASNLPGLKQYWLKASGLQNQSGEAPSQTSLKLEQIKTFRHIDTPQYRFTWDSSTDDKTANLEYTLVWFQRDSSSFNLYPIKTVNSEEPLQAVFGAASNESQYIWEELPSGVAYFVVYIKDFDGNITSSRILAIDFSSPYDPDTVLIDDNSISRNLWLTPRVSVNKNQLLFDVNPFIKDGRTLVPLRGIFEELGAVVSWEPDSKIVKAEREGTTVDLKIGSSTAYVNNSPVSLDVPALIVNGRTMVPLRFIGESFGAKVDWNPNLKLAKITI